MVLLAYVALILAPIAALILPAVYGVSARTILALIVLEWLFLPIIGIKIAEGIPLFDKTSVVSLSLLLIVLVFRARALLTLRPALVDLAMLLCCFSPIASSMENGLGFYDGLSSSFRQFVIWGGPYLVGRVLLREAKDFNELARILLIGSAIYFPLTLIESRLSPVLHGWIYGSRGGHLQWETADFFGPLRYKACVFLQSNLELAPLMGVGAICGWWLWKSGALKSVWGISSEWLIAAAAGSMLMGKSLGGFFLTLLGWGVLLLTKKYGRVVFLFAMLSIAPFYLVTRSAGLWSGQNLVDLIGTYVSQRRAESFAFRLTNEDQLFAKAIEKPWFGWGGWGRARVYDDNGKDISTTDGMWIIAAGDHGLVGLAALYGSMLLPGLCIVLRKDRALLWTDPQVAGVTVMIVVVCIHAIDCLANGMPNPIYYMAAGGLASVSRLPSLKPAGLNQLLAQRVQVRRLSPVGMATTIR